MCDMAKLYLCFKCLHQNIKFHYFSGVTFEHRWRPVYVSQMPEERRCDVKYFNSEKILKFWKINENLDTENWSTEKMMTSTFKQFTLLICKYLKSNSISRDGSSQKYSSPSQARDLDFKLKLYRAFVLFTSSLKIDSNFLSSPTYL